MRINTLYVGVGLQLPCLDHYVVGSAGFETCDEKMVVLGLLTVDLTVPGIFRPPRHLVQFRFHKMLLQAVSCKERK